MPFEDDYKAILEAGAWTRFGSCPVILEEWESIGEAPDQAIRLISEDVDTEEGSASDGSIIYEKEPGMIQVWANTKTDRNNIRLDIYDIIKASGDNALIVGYRPVTLMERKGFEMRIRRVV